MSESLLSVFSCMVSSLMHVVHLSIGWIWSKSSANRIFHAKFRFLYPKNLGWKTFLDEIFPFDWNYFKEMYINVTKKYHSYLRHPHFSREPWWPEVIAFEQPNCQKVKTLWCFQQWWEIQMLSRQTWYSGKEMRKKTCLVGGFNPSEKYESTWIISRLIKDVFFHIFL